MSTSGVRFPLQTGVLRQQRARTWIVRGMSVLGFGLFALFALDGILYVVR